MSRVNRLSPTPIASAVVGVLLIIAVFYVFAHEEAFWWLPSLFEKALRDKGYGYWHRWVHLSAWETFVIGFVIYIVWYIVSQTYDGIYKFVRKYPWVPLILPAVYLLLLVGRDLYTGYAIYDDRIALRSPLSGLDIREYRASDVVSVEVGCHERMRLAKRRPGWAVPSYRLTFRDGTTLSPFDMADSDFRNPHLMAAILRFDTLVQAAGVEKHYSVNLVAESPVRGGTCFNRMEGYFDPSLRPAMRKTFSTGAI
ncbi:MULTISPECIES: hypothetical protein [Asticcacaulis]|uniref:hypothetical protein n=1 Tax=Asticcacaulis TaxID=76890 RepID=UPI001AE12AFA|nr:MULTISPECIES: hypothetical protein [Asticcacaulis]MBP2158724.1 hypothetical protein [Asticcacaulis solisilvae]MDR6799770.1 hypothetical protein [Asticcacaulis sp. BE141]